VLRTDLPDHRRATEQDLLVALRAKDPLALAETYHRTIPAAHATARRLLSSSTEVEALLRAVYSELWDAPPTDTGLEGWVRARCFALASEDLRERDAAPASPSLTVLLPELPRPEVRYLDAAERALSELTDEQRRALLLAHDKGVPTAEQNAEEAPGALVEALLALAGPEPGSDPPQPDACADMVQLGDWVLGLLPADAATAVAADVAARPECTTLAKALRRGRRRLEGLPPTPDMGQRVLVTVLAGAPAPLRAAAPAADPGATAVIPSALDAPIGPPMVSDDTGEIAPLQDMDPPGPVHRNPSDIYAELSELAETGAADDDDHDDDDRDEDDDDYEHMPRRSMGARVLLWVLGALFLVAGVAAGLYLGLTLMN
jgi:DNA-directed RNA polymerase specialized sigma24 family protein